MTPTEFREVWDEVDSLWGRSPKWTERSFSRIFERFARKVTRQSAMDALHDMFLSGRAVAPSPSEVITEAHNRGGLERNDGTPCAHRDFHLLGFHADGTASEGVCRVCRTAFTWKPGEVFTDGDIEDRAAARREEMNAVAP